MNKHHGGSHALEPGCAYEPAAHAVHALRPDAFVTACCAHAAGAELPPPQYEPAGHAERSTPPDGQNQPGGHAPTPVALEEPDGQ